MTPEIALILKIVGIVCFTHSMYTFGLFDYSINKKEEL
jgi:hypothetical protein